VYKQLFAYPFLEQQASKDYYYNLNSLHEYITHNDYLGFIADHPDKNIYKELTECYRENLLFLKEHGLPHSKQEQFNTFNLNKLYRLDILNSDKSKWETGLYDKLEFLATSNENTIVTIDGEIYTTEVINKKTSAGVQILDYMKVGKQRHREYMKLIEKTGNFSNLSFGATTYPNVIVFPKGYESKYADSPVKIKYDSSQDDPVLEANTTIVDVPYDTHVKLVEEINTTAGQLNYTTYIVRDGATLEIDRTTVDAGGWSIFDSRFICHPNSTVKINCSNTGSQYTQENFYFKCSSGVKLELNGRNNIRKGNEYYSFVRVRSAGKDNVSNIDVKNIGNEQSKTSWIGKYEISAESVGFNGTMENKNLMLSSTAKMHTRPILDIYTKEIQCTHGCTISNVDKNQLYYLQSKGFDKATAKTMLVESFLC
jgi:Fe-S cluster assembly protein SufD|tara:strand:+ start:1359 stop:2636 length:1278 start_codon:yes stop_codon:yes gene_type:complete